MTQSGRPNWKKYGVSVNIIIVFSIIAKKSDLDHHLGHPHSPSHLSLFGLGNPQSWQQERYLTKNLANEGLRFAIQTERCPERVSWEATPSPGFRDNPWYAGSRDIWSDIRTENASMRVSEHVDSDRTWSLIPKPESPKNDTKFSEKDTKMLEWRRGHQKREDDPNNDRDRIFRKSQNSR